MTPPVGLTSSRRVHSVDVFSFSRQVDTKGWREVADANFGVGPSQQGVEIDNCQIESCGNTRAAASTPVSAAEEEIFDSKVQDDEDKEDDDAWYTEEHQL